MPNFTAPLSTAKIHERLTIGGELLWVLSLFAQRKFLAIAAKSRAKL